MARGVISELCRVYIGFSASTAGPAIFQPSRSPFNSFQTRTEVVSSIFYAYITYYLQYVFRPNYTETIPTIFGNPSEYAGTYSSTFFLRSVHRSKVFPEHAETVQTKLESGYG